MGRCGSENARCWNTGRVAFLECKNAMSENVTATENRIDKRTRRAQWEGFEFGVPTDGYVLVRNVSKAEPSVYTVAVEGGRASSCSCPDWTHREPNGGCKHMRAVEAQSGVMLAASVGGEVTREDARPADCTCLPTFERLPCWPCYRDHFETPNPNAEEQ